MHQTGVLRRTDKLAQGTVCVGGSEVCGARDTPRGEE